MNLTDYFTHRRVQIVVVPVQCVCGEFANIPVQLEHSREPDVSLPACRTCGTPMEPMRDDVIDTALHAVMDGIA